MLLKITPLILLLDSFLNEVFAAGEQIGACRHAWMAFDCLEVLVLETAGDLHATHTWEDRLVASSLVVWILHHSFKDHLVLYSLLKGGHVFEQSTLRLRNLKRQIK